MVKRFLNRIPFRIAMALSIGLFLLLGVVLSAVLINAFDSLWASLDTGKRVISDETLGGITMIYEYSNWVDTMNSIEGIVIPFILCSLGAVGGAAVFYRWKMKKPLTELFEGVKKVQDRDLDFNITYKSSDELGALCESFETMRSELDASFKTLWRAQEERKHLNAAFAHDLRTPLTVLKGQTDMLKKNIENGRLDKQKVTNTLLFMQESIMRCERYVNEMASLQRLEEITPEKRRVAVQEYAGKMKIGFDMLAGNEKAVTVNIVQPDAVINIDEGIVTQVLDNLVSNALRYARKDVSVKLDTAEGLLKIKVTDDGAGFSGDALRCGLEPFYRGSRQSEGGHLGLGLNICKLLAEKHGGGIILANAENGGGQVTATFSMKN